MQTARLAVLLAAPLPEAEKPLKLVMARQDTPGHWKAQLLGALDRPVGDRLEFGGQSIPAKVNDKGGLELDLKNDGKPRTISGKHEIITVPIKGSGDKPKAINAKLEFSKTGDKW